MKKHALILPAIVFVTFILAGSAHAQVSLYDADSHTLQTSALLGARTDSYDPSTGYAFAAYNGTNITYTEEAAGTTFTGFGSGDILKVTNNGGVDGFFRYTFFPSSVDAFAGSRTAANEPFLFDIDAFSTLEFDVVWDGTGTFGTIIVDINSNTAGATSFTLLNQSVAANTPTKMSVDLGVGSAFQDWVTAMGDAAVLGNTAQLRINVQSAASAAGTFGFDNINLIPEPSSAILLGLSGLFLALARRRK